MQLSPQVQEILRQLPPFASEHYESLKTVDEQKENIGEYIYNGIAVVMGPEAAGKIAGMLLELHIEELHNLMYPSTKYELGKLIGEAFDILSKAGGGGGEG